MDGVVPTKTGTSNMFSRLVRRFAGGGALALLSSILPHPIDAQAFSPPTIYRQTLDRPAPTTVGTPRYFSINSVMAKIGRTQDETLVPYRGSLQFFAETTAQPTSPPVMTSETPFSDRGLQLFGPLENGVGGKWKSVRENWIVERLEIGLCERSPERCSVPVQIFTKIFHDAVTLEGLDRLDYVNRRVNASVSYRSDLHRYGMDDVWSTPLATLGQAGDCEDYAIAKYFLLAASGQDERDMRILLVRDTRVGEDHAVLAVHLGGAWHVLDNRWNKIEADFELSHYGPIFSLSANGASAFAISEANSGATNPDEFMPSSSELSN